MKRSVIENATGLVVNVIKSEVEAPLPEGHSYAPQPGGEIGDKWQNGVWVKKNSTAVASPEVLAQRAEVRKDEMIADLDGVKSKERVFLKLLFAQENRVRALEGIDAISMDEFKTIVRDAII